MIVIAGPPGSGKSTTFPVSGFGLDYFNADDRAAELNGGSYLAIPLSVRQQVNREFESFILGHIRSRKSLAFETTLRSPVTFEQAEIAREEGFTVEMRYLALESFDLHLENIKVRADKGGHSAPEPVLRAIYDASLKNLPRAIRELDAVFVYDNSQWGTPPVLLLHTIHGGIVSRSDPPPEWLAAILPWL